MNLKQGLLLIILYEVIILFTGVVLYLDMVFEISIRY